MTVADELLTGLVASGLALRGEDGQNGIKGDKGDKGPKGDKGNKGETGADGVGPDEKVKLSASDPKAGFLADKLEGGRGIYLIQRDDAKGKRLVIEAAHTGAVIGVGGASGGGSGAVDSVNGQTGVVVVDASEVPFTPAGTISATNVQGAIEEVAAEAGGGSVTIADADPGAVGAGGLWLQTNAGEGGAEYVRLWVRNAADDGWISSGPISVLAGNVQTLVGPTATIEVGLDDDAGVFSVSGAPQVRLNAASVRVGSSVTVELREGTADPSAGGGLAALVGSLYMRQTAVDGVGSLWQKVGDADTEWALIFGDASLAAYVASGSISITSPGAISLIADPGANIELEGQALRLNNDFIAKEAYVDAAIAVALASAVMDGDAAGGDLSGTYPNPSVVDDSHSHTGATLPAGDIEATLLQGDDAGGQEITNLGLVEVDVSADDGFADAIIVRVPDPADLTGNAYVFRVVDPLDNILFDLDAYGAFAIFGNALGGNVGGIQVFAPGGPVVFKVLTSGVVEFGNGVPGVGNLQFDPAYPVAIFNQPVVLAHTTVPADADLFAGALALWYDKTNGAAEFEVKGKTADGTVVAQSFPVGVAPQTYAASNVTTDRTFDANSTTIDELADVLGTLIADLRARKIVA